MSLVLLVSSNQYLFSNDIYKSGIQQWLWLADCASVSHLCSEQSHRDYLQLSRSSCTQQDTWVFHPGGHSSHGFPTGQRIQERRKEKRMSRTKGLILQMASHRYATEHTNQPWHTWIPNTRQESIGGEPWLTSELQILINSSSLVLKWQTD